MELRTKLRLISEELTTLFAIVLLSTFDVSILTFSTLEFVTLLDTAPSAIRYPVKLTTEAVKNPPCVDSV